MQEQSNNPERQGLDAERNQQNNGNANEQRAPENMTGEQGGAGHTMGGGQNETTGVDYATRESDTVGQGSARSTDNQSREDEESRSSEQISGDSGQPFAGAKTASGGAQSSGDTNSNLGGARASVSDTGLGSTDSESSQGRDRGSRPVRSEDRE